ncbi:unnamed protein product [Cylicostephanus goldi]|uniref:Uncharacterized protein n=1 Tax=Cylicostephanus goldi TaxID=71465 RepID=A0A3P6RC30_CYLGO|nr:unnamed protein product [Cylicostephanus goldi]
MDLRICEALGHRSQHDVSTSKEQLSKTESMDTVRIDVLRQPTTTTDI